MIGDLARTLIIQSMTTKPLTTRARFFLKFEKDYKSDIPIENPNVIYTNGHYSMSYKPRPNKKDFAFSCDLFEGKSIRFNDYDDIGDGIIGTFFKKYTNFTPDYFRWAKDNPGVHFYFCLDYKKYEEDFREAMGERPHIFVPDQNYEAEKIREEIYQSNVGWDNERLKRKFEREYKEERDKKWQESETE